MAFQCSLLDGTLFLVENCSDQTNLVLLAVTTLRHVLHTLETSYKKNAFFQDGLRSFVYGRHRVSHPVLQLFIFVALPNACLVCPLLLARADDGGCGDVDVGARDCNVFLQRIVPAAFHCTGSVLAWIDWDGKIHCFVRCFLGSIFYYYRQGVRSCH